MFKGIVLRSIRILWDLEDLCPLGTWQGFLIQSLTLPPAVWELVTIPVCCPFGCSMAALGDWAHHLHSALALPEENFCLSIRVEAQVIALLPGTLSFNGGICETCGSWCPGA